MNLLAGSSWAILALFAVGHAQETHESSAIEKKLDSPSPIQWRAENTEISLVGLAWGPANSPEMQAKSRGKNARETPAFFAVRSYALALKFRARWPGVVTTEQYAASGLTLVRNVNGDFDVPLLLTPEGFVHFPGSPGVWDIDFKQSQTSEYWDVFAVPPDRKEFLFQIFDGAHSISHDGTPALSFRVTLRDGGFVISNAAVRERNSCSSFKKNFAGTIGADSNVKIQLTREGENLFGTEQYTRVGQTLWLQGIADALDNVSIEERYPKDVVSGILKGSFSQGCHAISGYFSKPDGSRLLPFELHEVDLSARPAGNTAPPREQ